MPRKGRIDAPDAVHHIIVRGIERREIFRDDADRDNFLDRLGLIIAETQTGCFAWALMPNHFHLLVKTGDARISKVMQRLLTGYAVSFNKRHQRAGHLFQNRYKSILCQEDPYLLELIRYIHLNPLRANVVRDLKELEKYPYCGHRTFFKKGCRPWQNTRYVLGLFHANPSRARQGYREFVSKGVEEGRRDDLVGGGLVRSAGGWASVNALRKAKIFQKSDERILGDGDFVEKVLSSTKEKLERRYRLKEEGIDFGTLLQRVAELMDVDPQVILSKDRGRLKVKARSLLCYWAFEDLGLKQPELAAKFGMTQPAVSMATKRGKEIAFQNKMRFR